jgi:hypothetical protein
LFEIVSIHAAVLWLVNLQSQPSVNLLSLVELFNDDKIDKKKIILVVSTPRVESVLHTYFV